MAKHRIMYPDGTLMGQWDNESERNTALDHSLVGTDWHRTDVMDENNFTITDKRTGKPLFKVIGPAVPKAEGSGDKPQGGNTPSPDSDATKQPNGQ